MINQSSACMKIDCVLYKSFMNMNFKFATVAVINLIRPDQINCLFHGSGGSIFLAFEKKKYINWIGVVLPATRQWHLRITTVVPCEHCMEVALVSPYEEVRGTLLFTQHCVNTHLVAHSVILEVGKKSP